jgi:aminoglycoside/choline kinase family phosphotransferase
MDRKEILQDWLHQVLPSEALELTTASADASFRRYFRVHLNGRSLIAMDAPPPQEDCRPFVHVAEVLKQAGLNVPEVIAHDYELGFLLLSDLGDETYLKALNEDTADELYRDAVGALIKMQTASSPATFPQYDEALLTYEMRLFPEWYVGRHLNIKLSDAEDQVLNQAFELLNRNILAQTKVYVHRDYHSRNLMVCRGDEGENPGVLDFQDAVYGPITYDLVSLFKDAYIIWEEERVLDWVIRYWQAARGAGLAVPTDFADFYRDFEWMGVQRHIKILGIFSRLYYRDGKAGYLKDMPLVMDYLRRACARYIELRPLLRLLDKLENNQPQVGYTF